MSVKIQILALILFMVSLLLLGAVDWRIALGVFLFTFANNLATNNPKN
jgi:hypothetical protein